MSANGWPKSASTPQTWSSVARAAVVATVRLPTRQIFQKLYLRSLVVVHTSRVPVAIGSLEVAAGPDAIAEAGQQQLVATIDERRPQLDPFRQRKMLHAGRSQVGRRNELVDIGRRAAD